MMIRLLNDTTGTKKDDLFLQLEDSEDWQLVKKHLNDIELNDKKKVVKNYNKLGNELGIMKLAMAKSSFSLTDFENMYIRLSKNYIDSFINHKDSLPIADAMKTKSVKSLLNVSVFGHYVKNKINRLTTEDEMVLMKYFPNPTFLHNFLNMADHKFVSKFRFLTIPIIAQNKKIYFIEDDFDMFLERKDNYGFKWNTLKPGFQLKDLSKILFNNNHFKKPKEQLFAIRFLNNFKIPFKEILLGTAFLKKHQKEKLKRVIFHIHGGGFICMSSDSHQSYLRPFVKKTGAALFSIDYPLAPASRYKQIIEIIFKSYVYVLVI